MVLVLCAYGKVRWDLSLAQGARVQKVILAGYHDQRLESAPKGVPVELYTHDGGSAQHFYAYQREEETYPQAVGTLKKLTGLEVSTFQGAYRYPGKPFVVGSANGEWMAQRILTDIDPLYRDAIVYERARQREAVGPLRFSAIHRTRGNGPFRATGGEFGRFTPLGPIAETLHRLPDGVGHVALDPRGPTYYGIFGGTVHRIDIKTGQTVELPIKDFDLAELSWPCGLAFDTKRGRLVLSSLGGEGFLYAYSPEEDKWTVLGSLREVDLLALSYAAEDDCYYGLGMSLGADRRMVIYQYDTKGQVVREVPLSEPVTISRSEAGSGYQLVSVGRQLSLLTPPQSDLSRPDMAESVRCILVDSRTGKVTYSGVVEPQPAAAAKALAADEVDALWETLKAQDRLVADRAMWQLAAGGDQSVRFLRTKFAPVEARDPERIRPLVAKFDHDDFRVREEASDELVRMGFSVEPALRQLLKDTLSAEARTRIEVTLRRIVDLSADKPPDELPSPELRREGRAVWVLGRIGTPAAVECLRELAGEVGAARAGQARAVLRQAGQR